MLITSFRFFVFVAVTLVVYYFCVPKKYQWCVLLAASYVFYAFAGLELFVFIISTTVSVYFGGIGLKKVKTQKTLIWAIVILNFGVLISFKWWNTLANIGNEFLDTQTVAAFRLPLNSLLLPLGISFYTFQAIGYLIDVYRGHAEPERNIAKFALFVSFFPQLIQGPISRHSEIAGQLYASRKFNNIDVLHGFQLMLWGLFKKLVIADRLIFIVTSVFSNGEEHNGIYMAIGMVVYTIWLYIDFSGGVDIARGVGQMFGILLPQNFIRPFFARSLPDFWRRFHISLNNWWRDYLFYPIVLSKPMAKLGRFIRKKIGPKAGKVTGVYITIIIVRLVNAMWLGASLFYVANGLYYGILIVLAMILEPVFQKVIKALYIDEKSIFWIFFQITRTFILGCVGHIFLAASGVAAAFKALARIADFRSWNVDINISFPGLLVIDRWVIFIAIAIVITAEIIQECGIEIRKTLGRQHLAIQMMMLMIGIWAIIIFGKYGFGHNPSAFVYMGF